MKYKAGDVIIVTGAPDVYFLIISVNNDGTYTEQAYSSIGDTGRTFQNPLGASADVPFAYFDNNPAYHRLASGLSPWVWVGTAGVVALLVIYLFLQRRTHGSMSRLPSGRG